jgi:hypothetical protein
MSLPLIIAAGLQLIDAFLTVFPNDIRAAVVLLKPSPWIWVAAFLGSLAIAHWWAWYDEHKRRKEEENRAQEEKEHQAEHYRVEVESKERDWRLERNALTAELAGLRTSLGSHPQVTLDYLNGSFVLRNHGSDAFSIQIGRVFLAPSSYISFPFVSSLRSSEDRLLPVDQLGLRGNSSEPSEETLLRILLDGLPEDEGLVTRNVLIDYTDKAAQPWISECELTYDRSSRLVRMEFIGFRPATPKPQVLVQPNNC